MYGESIAAVKYWRVQHYDDCALMSVADVVGQLTGHMPTEQEIIELAESTPSKTHPGSIYIKPENPSDATDGQRRKADHALVVTGIDANNGPRGTPPNA